MKLHLWILTLGISICLCSCDALKPANSTSSKKPDKVEDVTPQTSKVDTQKKPAVEEKVEPPTYMKYNERDMMDEINLVRSDPKAYVAYVQRYVRNFKSAGWDAASVQDEESAARELITELNKLGKLSTLKPHRKLYNVAVKHGMDAKRKGSLDHEGSDGSFPWERIRRGAMLNDGTENLVGGVEDIRKAVITLLVDSGIPNRGHRRALLDSKWEYVTCFKVGTIGDMPHNWIQLFAAK